MRVLGFFLTAFALVGCDDGEGGGDGDGDIDADVDTDTDADVDVDVDVDGDADGPDCREARTLGQCLVTDGCVPVFDDACCPACRRSHRCDPCEDFRFYRCDQVESWCDRTPVDCGFAPEWACRREVPDCSEADPASGEQPCTNVPGCVAATCPDCAEPATRCQPLTVGTCGGEADADCDSGPPDCPAGQVPEFSIGCATGSCVDEAVCRVPECVPGVAACPEVEPYAADPFAVNPCDTDPAVPCFFTVDGCSHHYRCSQCRWFQDGYGPLAECEGDSFSCLDEGCSEESVCTDCPCPELGLDERFRCVSPGGQCPPCEPKSRF